MVLKYINSIISIVIFIYLYKRRGVYCIKGGNIKDINVSNNAINDRGIS